MKQNDTKCENIKITDNFASKGLHKIMNDPDALYKQEEQSEFTLNNIPITEEFSNPSN